MVIYEASIKQAPEVMVVEAQLMFYGHPNLFVAHFVSSPTNFQSTTRMCVCVSSCI